MRRQQNERASTDEINYESMRTRDSLKIGLKLVVAFQVEDPALLMSRLKISEIEYHVENIAVSDMVRAVQLSTSQNFLNTGASSSSAASGTERASTQTVADQVCEELRHHLAECGIKLVRFNIEESKVLDEKIAQELGKQSLMAATANAEQAILSQKAAIARNQAEVEAMGRRVKQEQENSLRISAAQAELEATKLKAQGMLSEAEAERKKRGLEGEVLREYPELLQLELARLQFSALSGSTVNIVASDFKESPFPLMPNALFNGLGASRPPAAGK
jgi:regulator of protease activity HflC (stomatin/prohibitin superfamily)